MGETHEREGEGVDEDAEVAEDVAALREPEGRLELEAVRGDAVEEKDQQTHHQSDEAERRNAHEETGWKKIRETEYLGSLRTQRMRQITVIMNWRIARLRVGWEVGMGRLSRKSVITI